MTKPLPSAPLAIEENGTLRFLVRGTLEAGARYEEAPELAALYNEARQREMTLKSPFPYFGGKSKIAALVWERFGEVKNFVDPFFGSGAMLLGCPWPGHTETVNDIDALLANFFRALQYAPDEVAYWADYPVNEVDLHARHRYLRDARGQAEAFMQDPDKYDTKLAGWWVWGISQWIGSGWCPPPNSPELRADGSLKMKMPHMGGERSPDRGVAALHKFDHKQTADGGLSHQRPHLSGGKGGNKGMGVHRETLARKMPHVGAGWRGTEKGEGVHRETLTRGGIYDYFASLSARLRRVRVCCGDWGRVLGPSVTFRHGLTAVFLDPPYAQDGRADVYGYESRIFDDVRAWAIANGDNPLLRIALCGYDFAMPDGWRGVPWKAHGGYGSQGDGQGRANAHREIVWFSPACLDPTAIAHEAMTRPISVSASDFTGTLFEDAI